MLERLKRTIGKIGDFREDNDDIVKNLITGYIFGVGITSAVVGLINNAENKRIHNLSMVLVVLTAFFSIAPTSEGLDSLLINENEEE